MNILFHSNHITERGTEIALFDYALGNVNILKNNSFIASPKSGLSNVDVLEKFKQNFKVCLYETHEELIDFIKANGISLIYKIVHGGCKEGDIAEGIPHFIHCVFSTNNRYGTFYCGISEYLNFWFRTKYPSLPHIVKKFSGSTCSLHSVLNIPKDALVYGGYGGENNFSIVFAQAAVIETAAKNPNIHFIFLNFKPFTRNGEDFPNIHFLPKNVDRDYKEKFINTCDAMIHARKDGEIFSLAIAEFSVKNKPVITFAPNIKDNFFICVKQFIKFIIKMTPTYYKGHLFYLGNKAIKYSTSKKLIDIFVNFKSKYLKDINYDCYSEEYSEEKVMRIFGEIIKDK
ncbi:hypothetical protein AGMMS50212_00880 [Spirochaetia bacterium]|nr:hypothetical protein AGMMS50212_00880 [Spirochaetia bacterium]